MVDFPEQLAPLSHMEQSVFLMVLSDVPINPLSMSDVEKLANEVVSPVEASQDTGRSA